MNCYIMKLQKKEPKKKGPTKKILTEAEKEEKEALRKAKYEEFKAKKAEEKEKRRIRNEELRLKRKQKKVVTLETYITILKGTKYARLHIDHILL